MALGVYDLIKNATLQHILTLDEFVLPLDYGKGKTDYFCTLSSPPKRSAEKPFASTNPQFLYTQMSADGFSWLGPACWNAVEKGP